MTKIILLTESEAKAIAGESKPGHVIEPVPYRGGYFVSENVLNDPAHAEAIKKLPDTRLADLSEIERFGDSDEDLQEYANEALRLQRELRGEVL